MSAPIRLLAAPGLAVLALAAGALALVSCSSRNDTAQVLAAYDERGDYPPLAIRYPLNGTLFPPEIAPTGFSWQDAATNANAWLIRFQFADSTNALDRLCHSNAWLPAPADWEEIKRRSTAQEARVTILGFNRADASRALSRGRLTIRTSRDEVGAPIFYREVNLPFLDAVKDPSRIRWRFGSIASPQTPPIVLEGLPVCGNCHSFSQDGKILGMDVDYANNKGAYAITHTARRMSLASSEVISWNDFRQADGQQTYGLLSQVSPDGQSVVSTVKDRSVFVGTPGLAFSQLFFPIQGILAVYDRNSATFQALPGADDPEYVQSNPTWSPDGQFILFARAKRYQLKNDRSGKKVLLSAEDCAEFLNGEQTFQFDLYRIPFNHGKGGRAEPIKGASRNGRSNYFAKPSPDGKWIVFCQAKSFMLLQPDSELFIIPAEGGEPRRLAANTTRMNSWHSWSPNSRWLVFSSKAASDYTQLHLTHIDESGNSTPAILLSYFTAPDRAANIPEFVRLPPDAIEKIQPRFLDDNSHARAAYAFEQANDAEHAIAEYQKALTINPRNVHAHQRLGFLLYHTRRQFQEGLAHTAEALKLDANDACAHYDLGMAQMHQKQFAPAIEHFTQALKLMPEGLDSRYNPGDMHSSLASALITQQRLPEAAAELAIALKYAPKNPNFHYTLALVLAAQGRIEEPAQHYALAHSLAPALDTEPQYHNLMCLNYAQAGQYAEALAAAQKCLDLAAASGQTDLARELRERIEVLRQRANAAP
jgi:tetratricopeptide (TPR) repeat protein